MSRHTILISPADSKIYEFFSKRFNTISSDCLENMIPYEKQHADMQALNLNGKLFINDNCDNLKQKLNFIQHEYISCNDIGYNYPKNVALNCAFTGDKIICKEDAMHPKVKKYCLDNNIEIINVKQGYTKCSALIISNNSIITDDENIAKTLLSNNFNILLIEKGDIYLDDNTVGFIGGASVKIGNTVYFFGDINTHRDAKVIKEYINNAGLNIVCASKSKLIDLGGAVII